jgi:hypothetical protein
MPKPGMGSGMMRDAGRCMLPRTRSGTGRTRGRVRLASRERPPHCRSRAIREQGTGCALENEPLRGWVLVLFLQAIRLTEHLSGREGLAPGCSPRFSVPVVESGGGYVFHVERVPCSSLERPGADVAASPGVSGIPPPPGGAGPSPPDRGSSSGVIGSCESPSWWEARSSLISSS